MDINPKVGIILPTYNSCKTLGRAIDSVLSQTYDNYELVIIDNYSCDDTRNIVNSYKDTRIRYYLFNNGGVVAKSRNYAMSLLECEYVALLDSDDYWMPSKLKDSLYFLVNGYDVVYHKMRIKYTSKPKCWFKRKYLNTRQLKSPISIGLLSGLGVIPNSSLVIRVNLIKRDKMYIEDRDIIAAEDFELLLYLAQFTQKFKFIGKTLGCYTISNNNLSNRDMSIPFFIVLDKYADSFDNLTMKVFKDYGHYIKGKYLYSMNDFKSAKVQFLKVTKSHNLHFLIRSVIWFCRLQLVHVRSTLGKLVSFL
jgi:glycosyltransferase involved in cell wall biosynthesis